MISPKNTTGKEIKKVIDLLKERKIDPQFFYLESRQVILVYDICRFGEIKGDRLRFYNHLINKDDEISFKTIRSIAFYETSLELSKVIKKLSDKLIRFDLKAGT